MVLRRVDPTRPRGPVTRAWQAAADTAPGRWLGIHVASRVDPFLLRRSGGRVRSVGPFPTALLRTVGARTGAVRETPVVYFHDGTDVVLVASSFGRERHPGWYHNLRAHPASVRLNGEPYLAEVVTDPAEVERLFALATRVYPGYASYRRLAGRSGRRIPVLRLSPGPARRPGP